MSDTLDEITCTLTRLQAEIEDLAVGGLRAAGPDRLPMLEATREDLHRVGAFHLAGRLETLTKSIEADDKNAADALMRTQASLRVFERLLTLEHAGAWLGTLVPPGEGEGDSE